MSDVQVDSINPNIPVTSNLTKGGTIEADATGGPLSFDELEEVTQTQKKAKAEKKQPKQEKSKDLTSDTDKGKEKSPQPREAKKPEGKAESQETDEPVAPPRKTVKAKFAESEYDLDEESLVPVKINGREEMVQLKDILGNYSGKVAWDKKFSEVDQTRKSVAAQELKLREVSDLIKEVYAEQDPNMKMYRMSQIAGIDPVEFRTKFFNENIQLLEKFYSMSEDERRADALSYEANVHKHRADTLEKSIKDKQDFESLSTRVAGLRERHQVSERDFVAKYDQIERMVQNGQIDARDATPEYIMDAIQVDRLWDKAATQLESLDLGWNENTKINNLQKLVGNAHKMGLKPQDMAEMVDELWGVKKAQRKIDEKLKANKEFLSGKQPVAQTRAKQDEAWSFEDI